MTDSPSLASIVTPLLDWYRAVRRPLPWRDEPTPYHVWISEIMLQQTRIEAALPYYQRFLTALPDVAALAAVDDDGLMKLWEGLGYYSRARNLKKAARVLMDDHGGILPADAAALKKLPGIGNYTAGAIASIAYGLPEPAVDGNVLRVLMRLLAREDDVLRQNTKNQAAAWLRRVYPSGTAAGEFTQGLMELGERVCLPNGEPLCALCPLAGQCLARAQGAPARYPVRSEKKPRRVENRTVLLLRRGEKYAIRRRPAAGLLAGLWEFPSLPGIVSTELVTEHLFSLGLAPSSCRDCGKAKHVFSHVEWHMTGRMADCGTEGGGFTWVTREQLQKEYPIPSAFRAWLELIG